MAQGIELAAIQQGYRVLYYRETHTLLDELADAALHRGFLFWAVFALLNGVLICCG